MRIIKAVVFLALAFIACSSPSQPVPTPKATTSAGTSVVTPTVSQLAIPNVKKGGRFKYYDQAPSASLDPVKCTSHACQGRVSLVYSRLVKPVKGEGLYDTRLAPDLAEKWETSSDGLTWTFSLRNGVKWANLPPLNGRELTSGDVTYSFGLYAQGQDSPWQDKYASIKEVKALDKYRVRFTLKAPNLQFLPLLASEPSWVLPREITALDKEAMGTGPFKITRFSPEVGIFYDKNSDYFRAEQVFLDGVDVNVIPDKNTAIAVFRTGGLDTLGYPPQHDLSKSEVEELKTNVPGVRVDGVYRNLVWSLGIKFNCQCPLDKLEVRRAINHALDRDSLIQIMTEGLGTYADTFPNQNFPDYALPQDELKDLQKFDLSLAKKFMADAGHTGSVTVPIFYSPAFRHPQYVELEAQMLAEANIILDARKYQVDYLTWVKGSYSGDYAGVAQWGYATSGFWDYFQGVHHSQGGLNGPRTSIPEVDKAVADAMRTLDPAEQVAKARKLERRLLSDYLYVIPLHTQPGYLVRQPWVRNLNLSMGAMSGILSSEYIAWVWLDK